MKRFIAVDAGKYATKVAEYLQSEDRTIQSVFETKTGTGDFRDDAIEKNTFIAEIGGNVMKIGRGAVGDGAMLETSKQTDIHKNCTLAAIATHCSDGEEDEICLATGLPAKEWAVVEKREQYKAFFPTDRQTIRIKMDSSSPVQEKNFVIKKIYVFPESIGAMFQDDSPAFSSDVLTGVLDIGRLNLNATMWQGADFIQEESVTDELGAAALISGLAQELSANFSRVDERLVETILKKKPSKRVLPGSPEIQEKSRAFIHDYLMKHAEKIKRCCDARKWSLDYMNLIAIGGTSAILREELKEVFGNRMVFLESMEFANAYGYLRLMCSRIPEIKKIIPLKARTETQEQ